ncbi:MAG: hypothetical protein ACP5N2_03905 [Candidatus Nanoarchaeia archaeon]
MQKNSITNYKKYLQAEFTNPNLTNIGKKSDSNSSWYDVKKLQFISGMAKFALDEKNNELLTSVKKVFLFAISNQKADGYYLSDIYSSDHQKMRANVIFINIELFNTFELIKDELSEDETKIFFESINKSTKYIKSFLKPSSEINQNIAGLLYFLFCKKYNLSGGEEVEHYKDLVITLQNDYGYWGEKKEAAGFDALYGTLSLGYLARASDLDDSLSDSLTKGVQFVNYFMQNGDVDLSFSKRWIQNTPQGHRFFIYALAKSGHNISKYIKKCFDSPDLKESYYILKSLNYLDKQDRKFNKIQDGNFGRINKKTNGDMTLVISNQPGRVSGGEICSIYHKNKGWLIQQPLIEKEKLPELCSQVRVYSKNKIYTSYLDHHAIISNIKCLTILREENEKFAKFPYGYYQSEIATSNILLERTYELQKDFVTITGKLFFDEAINKIEVIIPLLNGEIFSDYVSEIKQAQSPYGMLSVNILTIPFSKGVASFSIKIS